MKKILLLVCIPLLLPLAAQADVSVDINVPGVSLHLGDQDRRGYYWDGYDWRPPQWWHAHQGRGLGERNARGLYWDGGRWQPSPPRGYEHRQPARSGNPFHGDRDNRDHDRRHDDRGDHDRCDDARGQPYPPGNAGPHR
ncbi:DUF2502 domain-containing protein [Serratia marcescens]|uniref:DUF2502 domain-containing protein n=1 Tax=Serratia marcescens TaxID=615 RepID=UPI002B259AF6|nr:DUF2502 domain-containing protein [Serratia marcescens]WPJ25911.1 DUF2502 domain-containing protein [Serratia marcescens]